MTLAAAAVQTLACATYAGKARLVASGLKGEIGGNGAAVFFEEGFGERWLVYLALIQRSPLRTKNQTEARVRAKT